MCGGDYIREGLCPCCKNAASVSEVLALSSWSSEGYIWLKITTLFHLKSEASVAHWILSFIFLRPWHFIFPYFCVAIVFIFFFLLADVCSQWFYFHTIMMTSSFKKKRKKSTGYHVLWIAADWWQISFQYFCPIIRKVTLPKHVVTRNTCMHNHLVWVNA